MKLSRSLVGVLAVAAALSAGGGASARGGHDHEAARAALARGEILPLTRILTLVAKQARGDILEIELQREQARFIYEVRVLTPAGKVVEVKFDARTGARIEDSGPPKSPKLSKPGPDEKDAKDRDAGADRRR